MKISKPTLILSFFILSFLSLTLSVNVLAQPYNGTIFIESEIITSSDPTTFESISYTGRGTRTVYDRRTADWEVINAYLFDIKWDDGLSTEAQVNPEFGSEIDARIEAEKYGKAVGQLPTALRVDVDALWIHKGVELFGGGNRSILIHTGQSANYEADGILEETLVHEASHTSLDAAHASSSGWINAQNADPNFISTYARDNPTREDIAESFLTWLAIRHRSDRISQINYEKITETIPNRIIYFDDQNFNLYPIEDKVNAIKEPKELALGKSISAFPNPFSDHITIRCELVDEETSSLDVYDLFGNKVRSLFPVEKLASGVFLYYWDGRYENGDFLPNGQYITQMRSSGQVIGVSKLLLMR